MIRKKLSNRVLRVLSICVVALLAIGGTLTAIAADDSITVNSTTLTLSNDATSNGYANIGDTVTVTVNLNNTDGGCAASGTTITANMTAYGGGAAVAVPCTSDNGGVGDVFTLNHVITNAAGNGIDVGVNNAASAVMLSITDSDEAAGGTNPAPMTPITNNLGDGTIDTATTNGVDTIAPSVVSRVMLDTNTADGSAGTTDGQLDGVLVTFDDTMDASSAISTDFVMTTSSNGALTENYSDTTDDTTLFFQVTDSAANDTADLIKSQIVGSIMDTAGNAVALDGAGVSSTDGASPVILSYDYEDLNGDGTVDNIYLQFTENLDDDVASMTSSDFSVTINGSTTGQGGAEMVETLDVGVVDDDEIDINFTNGLTFTTNADYEISVAANKVGDASGNYLSPLTAFDCNDGAAPVFASVSPATNDYVNNTKVSYTISETLAGGQITWTRTGGSADGGSPHNQSLVGGELTSGAHTDITLTNNPTLVDGTVYTISFDGGDGGQPATQVNSTNVTYDTTNPSPTVAVDTMPIYEGDLTQQVTIRYDESMDNTTTPTVVFSHPANWGGPTGGTWSTTTFTNDTYTVNFAHDGTAEVTLPETITVGATSGATDLAGNADNAGSTTFGVDTVDPVPTITSAPNPTSGTDTITFTATDTGGTGVNSTTCSVDGATFTACSSGDAYSTLGGWGGLADGAFTLTLRVTDNAGNTDDDTASSFKDTTNPVTTITSAPTPTNGTQTFTFTATDTGGSGVASTTCSTGGAFAACSSGDAYSTLNGWGALPEGAFTLTVRTTDNVGLTHDDTALVTKDTIAPGAPAAPDMQAASDTGSSNSDNLTNDNTPTFDVVASAGTSTMTLISDVDGTIGTRVGSGAITASALSEGAHGITVVETDAAGNSSPASAPLGIVIDTIAPVLVETTPVVDPTNDQTPDVSFSSNEVGSISWAGGCNSTTTSAVAAAQTITLDSDGAGGNLAEATYNCTLTVTDTAGNATGLGLSAFTIDITSPTGTTTTGTATLYEGDLIQEITVTYDEPMNPVSTPTISFAGTTGTFASNSDGVWAAPTTWTETFTMTDADEEVVGATVNSAGAIDLAGNLEGPPVNGTFNVDTLAPTLTTVTIASNNATDTTKAAIGDTITLTITGSETINQPVVAYTSGAVPVTNATTYGGAWTASYIVNAADTEGAVGYTIDYTDTIGNNGTQVTTTTDSSSVYYDNSAPVVVTYSPADDATGVSIGGNLDLTFDENVVVGAGNVVIYKASDDSVFETIDITGANVTFDGTTGVTINPTTNFAYSTSYYVQIDNTAIENTVGLAYAGIADKTTWNFTTQAQPATGGGGGGGGGGRRSSPPATTTTTDASTTLVFSDIAEHWAEDYINEAKEAGYVEGYEDQTFKPDQYIARSEAAKLIAMWLDANIGDDTCNADLFVDVDCSSWYAKYVTYLSNAGIIQGYEDGTFGPGNYINRAEALKMMLFAKALQDSDIADIANPFSDVTMDDWFYNYVMIGYKLSIIQGYEDGTFGPGRNITRAEFTKIFVETLMNN